VRHLPISVLALLLLGCSSGDGEMEDSAGAAPPGNVPAPPEADLTTSVSTLFVVGDSLSDVGNAASTVDYLLGRTIEPPTIGLCNPADVLAIPRGCDDLFYRQSRVSDGPLAVEHLAEHLGTSELKPSFHVLPNGPKAGTDYAVASATARGQGVEDLARQVDLLLLDHRPLPANALYVVLIGGNDAIDALQAATGGGSSAGQTSAEIVTAAVAAIGVNVERLLDFGGRRLVVANVPDLAALPAVLRDAQASSDAAAFLDTASSISEAFNRELAARLEQIARNVRWNSSTPPVLVQFDLHAALSAAAKTAAANGHNTVDACFDSDAYRESAAAERVFHPDCAPQMGSPPRFVDFVFWDKIHPTGVTHTAIGSALIERVEARSGNLFSG
jgi:phospholipase/lecithinase/hemolysin